MNRIQKLISATLLMGAAVLFAFPLVAQETSAAGQAASVGEDMMPGLTLAEVEAALAAIKADTGIEEGIKNQLRTQYNQAIEALKEAADFSTRAANYREAAKAVPRQTAQLRAELKALPSTESAAQVTPTGSTEDLQREIDSRRAALDELNDTLANITRELARVKNRPFEISSRLPETRRELSEVREQLASPRLAEDAASPGRVADRILLQARQSRLVSEAEMLDEEQLSQSVREDLLQAQQDLRKAQLQNASVALDILEVLLQEHLTSEAQRVAAVAEMIPKHVPEGDEAAQALAAEVQTLGTEFEEVVQNLKQVKAAQDDLMARLEQLTDRYGSVREQLDVSVGGRGMAQILSDMQSRFRHQLAYTKELMAQLPPLSEMRLAELQIRAKLRSHPDVENRFADHRARHSRTSAGKTPDWRGPRADRSEGAPGLHGSLCLHYQ